MNPIRTALCIALVAVLAACQARTPDPAPASGDASKGTLAETIADAARKIETQDITMRIENGSSRTAVITPAGDLIIDGKTLPIDATQRRALLDYRARVSDMAQAGAAVGAAGAELAGKAVTEAIGSIFSGKPDEVGKRVEAQAAGIKEAARKLCDRVPALQEAQRNVAAAIPEFAPFAKTKTGTTEKCHADFDSDSGDDEAPAAPEAPSAPAAPAAPTAAA